MLFSIAVVVTMVYLSYSTMDKNCVIIGVIAGKGGVGKSTTTVSLAQELGKKFRVGILDADVYGPSIAEMLPFDSAPEERGDRIVPAQSGNVKMISLGHFGEQSLAVRAPVANGLIEQFLHNVIWGELDYLLIDFPPGTGDVQLTLMQQAKLSGALIVTTPDKVALADVRKAMAMCTRMGVPMLGIVENMSYIDVEGKRAYPFGQGGAETLSKEWELPALAHIPLGDLSPFKQLAQTLSAFDFARDEPELAIQEEGLVVQWPDEKLVCSLSALQKRCPCVLCDGEGASDVDAAAVQLVGRYGVKIHFTSGCSHGIYSYPLLREVANL